MSFLGSAAAASSAIQVGGSALSLVSAGKALLFGPDLPPGIAGFVFDIPVNEQVQMAAQITDHWLETNVAVQDHIAFEPIKINLVGIIAELIYTKSALEAYLQQVLDRLTPLGVLTPEAAQSAQKYLSEASRLKSAVTSAIGQLGDLAGMFSDGYGKNNQQKAYIALTDMYKNRAILTVETPWKTFDSMAIVSLSFEQDESTKEMTTVTASFKEMRFVMIKTMAGKLAGRIKAQKADTANKGNSKGKSVLATGFDAATGGG